MDCDIVRSHVNNLNNYLLNQLNVEVTLSSLQTLMDMINTDSKIDYIFDIIFHSNSGLLHFIKEIRKSDNVNSDVVNRSFDLLDCISKDFVNILDKYILELLETFKVCIFWAKSSVIRLRSYGTAKNMVKNSTIIDQSYIDRLKYFLLDLMFKKYVTSSHEKKNNYELIGLIIKHHPTIIGRQTQNQLFRKLISDLITQLRSDKPVPTELEGLYKCLHSFLKSYKESVQSEDQKLYLVVKDGCNLNLHRRTSIRTTFKIVRDHSNVFIDSIYRDYKWWYDILHEYLNSSNKNDNNIAFAVLNIFYAQMGSILIKKSDEKDKLILRFFIDNLKRGMQSNKTFEITLAMKNLGYFVEACTILGEIPEIESIFTLTAQMVEKYSSGIIDKNIELRHLSDLLISITRIAKSLNLESFGENKLNILRKLTIFVITCFPKIPVSFQITVKQSLLISINNMAQINETIFDAYLEKTVFISLIKSCSCLLESDVDFLKDQLNEEEFISYKSYICLWQDLCNIQSIPSSPEIDKVKFVLRSHSIDMKIFDKFIIAVLKIIEKLDFSVNDTELSNKIMNYTEYSLKPNKESDFYILFNLTEIFSSVIKYANLEYLEYWIPQLMTSFIKHATNCRIKYGFYKLLTVLFQKCGSEFNFDEHININQLDSFLRHVLSHVCELQGAELFSCLHMIMNCPNCFIHLILPYTVSLFQIVFTAGIKDFLLAEEGLNTLEDWCLIFPEEDIKHILNSIVPYFIPYLKNKQYIGDTDELTNYEKKLLLPVITQSKSKIYKKYQKSYFNSINPELLKLQKRIVKFLGEIDIEICSSFYNTNSFATSEFTEVLKFDVPFVDMKIKVFFDKFLPRLIELAYNSNDFKTRVVACEVLHSTTTIFILNSHNFVDEYPKPVENLFKTLLECIFKLGADSNEIIKQLFHPLCVQLVHYYSSKSQYQSIITNIFLETAFDCVSNNNDGGLRQCTAQLIGEFIRWSIKQLDTDIHESSNVLAVIKRICLFSTLPSCYKRLGAALVFNNIYRDLREDINILNQYWIELLYYFVKSLSLSLEDDFNNNETSNALDHIKRVLSEKSEIFNEHCRFRRIPMVMKGDTLNDAIEWMFIHCTSQNEYCRNKCMELITDLSSKIPGCESFKFYFQSLNSDTRNKILDSYSGCINFYRDSLALHDINLGTENKIITNIIKSMQSLLYGFHCFHWLLSTDVLSFEYLHSNTSFWESLQHFVESVMPLDLKTYLDLYYPSFTAQISTSDESTFNLVKQQVFFKILEILAISVQYVELFTGNELFQDNVWTHFVIYLFQPESFTSGSFSTESISKHIMNVLMKLNEVPVEKLNFIYLKFSVFPHYSSFWNSLTVLSENFGLNSRIDQQYLNGLFKLDEAQILPFIIPDIDQLRQKIIKNIFISLNNNEILITSFLTDLLTFCLRSASIDEIMNLMCDSNVIFRRGNNITTNGQNFFVNFKKPLIQYLSKNQWYLIYSCLEQLHLITRSKIQIISECLLFASESKETINFEKLIIGIYENWATLVQWNIVHPEYSSYLLTILNNSFGIYKNLVTTKQSHLSAPLRWVLDHLCDSKESALTKKEILCLLHLFINEEMDKYDNIIFQEKLQTFQNQHFKPSIENEINENECILLFNSLLTFLNESSNITVFRCVIYIYGYNNLNVCDEVIHRTLISIIQSLSSSHQLQFLMVPYQIFKNENNDVTFNFRCIETFLVPLLYIVSSECVKIFFINEFIFIKQMLTLNSSVHSTNEMENIIISKQICAVLLIEAYCDLIEEFDCLEIRQLLNSPEENIIRKELTKIILGIILKNVNLRNTDNESLLRKLKCYAYNNLIKIIKRIQREERFFKILFTKNIWTNIVDNKNRIELKMFVDALPTQKKSIIQKRRNLKNENLNKTYSIPSQYLSTSSLAHDIVKFDMSEWNVNTEPVARNSELYSVNLEEDVLNKHECMDQLCGLINYIVQSGISPLSNFSENEVDSIPEWMDYFFESLRIHFHERNRNIVIFLLKVVYNCEDIFYQFAYSYETLIIDCLVFLNEINYFVADVIVMLLKWHLKSLNKNKLINNKSTRNRLFQLLLSRINYDKTVIRNYQLELISTVIEFWNDNINPPFEELLRLMQEKKDEPLEVCLVISRRFLKNNIFPFNRENKIQYLFNFLPLMNGNFKRSNMLLLFEILALMLRIFKKNGDILTFTEYIDLKKKLIDNLNNLKFDNVKSKTDLFFSCLHRVVEHEPEILQNFIDYLLDNFSKCQGEYKIKCLIILNKDISQLPNYTFDHLIHQQFLYCLRGSDHELLKNSLMLIKNLLNQIDEKYMEDLLPDITRHSSHVSSECRDLVYSIAENIYSRYENSSYEKYTKIKTQCKAILLNGLLDNDSKLQEINFSFWKSKIELDKPINIPFLNIINVMYSSLNESQFLCNAVNYLLEACSLTPDFESKIFDNPLHNCSFEDYKIISTWRKNRSLAPMFVNSLASQLISMSQSSNFNSTLFVVRGTQNNLIFQPTICSKVNNDAGSISFSGSNYSQFKSSSSYNYSNKATTQSSNEDFFEKENVKLKKLQRRLHENSTKASEFFSVKNAKRKERCKILLNERTERREKQIYFSRKYRTGDYPDVEISRSAIIVPLKMLAIRDPTMAKLIFVSIFDGIVEKITDKKNFFKSVNKSLNEILKFSSQHNSIFMETIFEIAFNYPSDIFLDSQQIVISSHSSGLLSLGALLLENNIYNELSNENICHTSKKLKVDNSQNDAWTQLADLYKALDKTEVVNGILKEKIIDNTFFELRKGLQFEQMGNMENAYHIYEQEVVNLKQKFNNFYDERFILEAYFNSAAHLSKWEEINTVIKNRFKNVDDLWNENWDVEHTLPWLFSSEAYLCAENLDISDYTKEKNIVNCWLQDEDKKNILTNLLAEPLSILLFLSENERIKSHCLVNESLEFILENWNHTRFSKDKFSALQTLSEINTMLNVFNVTEDNSFTRNINNMLTIWNQNIPQGKNLIWWDKRTMYRLCFAQFYIEKLDSKENTCVKNQLEEFKYISCLALFENALSEQNCEVAEKYLIKCKELEEECGHKFLDSHDVKYRLVLNFSKILFLKALKSDPSDKLNTFVKCLQILDESELNADFMYNYHIHLANVVSKIIEDHALFLSSSAAKIELISKLRIVFKKFDLNEENIFYELRNDILWNYEEAASISIRDNYSYSKISEAYLALGKYCRQFLEIDDLSIAQQKNYEKRSIISILNAMKYDSKDAQILFPVLLELKHIKEHSFIELFISECEKVEEWKFLPWIHQLLAYLNTDITPVVKNIIIRIAEKYPNAFQFSLLPYVEKLENLGLYEKLRFILNQHCKVFQLVKALANVRVPETYFRNCVQKFFKLYSVGNLNELKNEAVKLENELNFSSNSPLTGRLFMNNCLQKSMKKCIEKIKIYASDKGAIHSAVSEFEKDINVEEERVRKSEDKYRKMLMSYCPWLVNFSEKRISDIEIPGQYDGFSCPNSERHVKIYEFDKRVEVQNSKQQPIKITIIGNDGKKYLYLIKFEEDMRQDQRIQQIFTILNRCSLSSNKNLQNLSIKTYGVFPLALNFGIIEWIEDTIPLRDFMYYGVSSQNKREQEKKRDEMVYKYYDELIDRYCKTNKPRNIYEPYEEATKKHNETDIIALFQNFVKKIPVDVFRKSLLNLCRTESTYWYLRNQFMISYCTNCIYGWILGIGDRHLKNTLVSLKTGNCIEIDFGYAFGTGAECIPVPELIPFRMTPHIPSLMAPFYLTGLIRETIIEILQTIYDNEYILFSILQIFILEPSLNWLSHTKRKMQEQNNENLCDIYWYPLHKIETVKRKLHGVNPVKILIEEISKNEVITKSYRDACIKLLTRENKIRMKMKEDNLTPIEQAECLLDLATDECILGLSWKGLESYI